jgi:hypothetical protein
MDLTVYTRRPEREATCRACVQQRSGVWSATQDPPDHTCWTRPATPRATLEERARDANRVLLDRELEIRTTRLAEINRGIAD